MFSSIINKLEIFVKTDLIQFKKYPVYYNKCF